MWYETTKMLGPSWQHGVLRMSGPRSTQPRYTNFEGVKLSRKPTCSILPKKLPIHKSLSEQSASMWVESCQYDEDSDNSNNRTSARGDHQQSPSEDSHGNSRARLVIQPSLDTTINDVDRPFWERVLTSEYWSRNNSWLRAA